MLQSLILIDVVFCLLGEKREREKKKGTNSWVAFFFFLPELDMPCWLYPTEFSWLLGAIKG
jgi:hypothetical protein